MKMDDRIASSADLQLPVAAGKERIDCLFWPVFAVGATVLFTGFICLSGMKRFSDIKFHWPMHILFEILAYPGGKFNMGRNYPALTLKLLLQYKTPHLAKTSNLC